LVTLGLFCPALIVCLAELYPAFFEGASIIVPVGLLVPLVRRYAELAAFDETSYHLIILSVLFFYSVAFVVGSLFSTRLWLYRSSFVHLFKLLIRPVYSAKARKGKIAICLFMSFSLLGVAWGIVGWVWGIFLLSCARINLFDFFLTLLPCSRSIFDFLKVNFYGLLTLATIMMTTYICVMLVKKLNDK